jgi:predicted nucleic acid-binding protein
MEQGPIEVFIDASVLFAASDSSTGASREIIRYAQRGVNKFVLDETAKNLGSKRPKALPVFQVIREAIPFKIVNPTRTEVLEMQPHTAFKDAPHFATAIKANVYCIVSLDRKHMIDIRDRVQEKLRLRILYPAELLEELRARKDFGGDQLVP